MKKLILSESQLRYIVNAVNENQFDETRTPYCTLALNHKDIDRITVRKLQRYARVAQNQCVTNSKGVLMN